MPTITLPPTVAAGQTIEAAAWGNVVKTALERLPRGLMAKTDAQTSSAIRAALTTTSEAQLNMATPAIATEAGRTYRMRWEFSTRNMQALTSYATVRVRRGTTTAGTTIWGPGHVSDRSGTASRDTIIIEAVDAPGAQAAQQWTLTMALDAAVSVDIYDPVLVTVEDLGVTP